MEWDTPSGSTTSQAGLRLLRLAVDTHLITSHHALPLLIARARRPARGGHRRHREYNADDYRLSASTTSRRRR